MTVAKVIPSRLNKVFIRLVSVRVHRVAQPVVFHLAQSIQIIVPYTLYQFVIEQRYVCVTKIQWNDFDLTPIFCLYSHCMSIICRVEVMVFRVVLMLPIV